MNEEIEQIRIDMPAQIHTDEARKVVATGYLSIVCDNDFWENAGKEQVLNVIAEILNARHENEEIANLFFPRFLGPCSCNLVNLTRP